MGLKQDGEAPQRPRVGGEKAVRLVADQALLLRPRFERDEKFPDLLVSRVHAQKVGLAYILRLAWESKASWSPRDGLAIERSPPQLSCWIRVQSASGINVMSRSGAPSPATPPDVVSRETILPYGRTAHPTAPATTELKCSNVGVGSLFGGNGPKKPTKSRARFAADAGAAGSVEGWLPAPEVL